MAVCLVDKKVSMATSFDLSRIIIISRATILVEYSRLELVVMD